MRLRDLSSDDALSYRRLLHMAFGGEPQAPDAADDSDAAEQRELFAGEIAVGIPSSQLPGGAAGEMAAGALIRPDRIALGGGQAPCGGIGGVAVHPAHRSGGLFRELMTGVIARCAQEGMAFSMLYPANVSIYRSLGYQVVTQVERIIVPLVDLQRLRPVAGRRLEPVTEASMPRVRALYAELSAGDNGMLVREGPLFPPEHPGGTWSAVLLVDDAGTDRGYVSWSRTAEGGGPGLEVHELMGRDREDRRALLHSLSSWSTVTDEISLRVRAEDPVIDALPGGRARRDPQVMPLVMVRVIDTARALQARPAPAGITGAFRLRVQDASVPEGTARAAGCWDVHLDDGTVTAHAADPSSPAPRAGEVAADIHAASLLLIGGRTVADAERLGIDVSADASARSLLDALLAGPRPAVMDQF